MPFEDGRPTPDEIERQREVDAYLELERSRSLPKKIADEADQTSQRSAVFYSALAVVIAVIATSCAALAIHGF
jgi:hypothetical protein